MTHHILALRGCAPTPLAHYLKALGVFRLVAEQRDPNARAFWRDDAFHLVSTLDHDALLSFVCNEFSPTPMLSPWNGGSGFYQKDNHAALDALVASKATRFHAYRFAIEQVKARLGDREERPAGDEKDAMLAQCAREWSEASLPWLNATVAPTREGKGKYPALLGTGGNDGRLDFTNNLMQRLVELIELDSGTATAAAAVSATTALFGTTGRGLVSAAIGQFHPGGAGGANISPGFDGESLFNPWDYVFALEGALVLRIGAARKLEGSNTPLAAAPFALHGMPGGYATATGSDDDGRGEQWMPLWGSPTTYPELQRLFAEGRLVAGSKHPNGALDGARAIAQLGVARGVTAFQRYGFMVRNGLANLAVPLERVVTRNSPHQNVRLIDELDPWLAALKRASGDKHAPDVFGRVVRRLEAILFDLCIQTSPGPRDWCTLVEELGNAEHLVVRSPHFAAERRLRPLRLSARWFDAADDGSLEYRLAASVASAHGPLRDGRVDALGPARVHTMPLDETKQYRAFAASEDSLRRDPRVVWAGSDLVIDLCAVVARRAMESQRAGIDGLALVGDYHAALPDLARFVVADVDDSRIARLTQGLMAVDGGRRDSQRETTSLPLYALFRLANLDAHAGSVLPAGMQPRCDPQMIRLLIAGRLQDASRLALTRLGAMGLRPKVRIVAGSATLAQRLAASLAFPIAPRDVRHLLDAITKPAHATENP